MSGRDQMADYLTHTAGFIRHNAGQIEARRPVVYQDHGDVLPLKFGNQVGLALPARMTPSICLLWAVRVHSSAVEIRSW